MYFIRWIYQCFSCSPQASEPIFRSQPTCWEAVRFNMLETLSLSAERVFLEKSLLTQRTHFPSCPGRNDGCHWTQRRKVRLAWRFQGRVWFMIRLNVCHSGQCEKLKTLGERMKHSVSKTLRPLKNLFNIYAGAFSSGSSLWTLTERGSVSKIWWPEH